MSYWRTYYHLVWTTYRRMPMIVEPRVVMINQAIRVKARDLGAYVHAIGTMPEHVHVAASIPPTIAVTDFVRHLKGSTSRFLNVNTDSARFGQFQWQAEYGVLTFGERSLPAIIHYLEHQAEHHATGQLWQMFEEEG